MPRMSMPRPEFEGVIGRTYDESEGWWPPVPSAPEGAPNVVIVLLDDVGYAQLGCYGSDIATPCFDRLAGEGHRYSNFHTTALCSPTRACLLTGRNHHSNGMARIVEFAAGFPGYNATIPHENGFLSEILVRNGYATFAVGKWHLTPASEMTMGSPRDKWPLGRGFERFYGFMGGETDQYHPELVYDNHFVEPPRTPEEGYHLTEDLADQAILFMKDLRATAPDKPFFLWFTPGACHAPHQAPKEYIEPYRGQFDLGLGRVARAGVRSARSSSGLLPEGTRLSERPAWVPAWDSLTDDERHLYGRMMEVFAGFLTHTDAQVQRVLDFIDELGEVDDTIVIVMSDNGASAEGGAKGSFNEQYFFNFVPESTEENLRAHRRPRHAPRQQPLPVGLGVGRATRRSSGSSATPTRAAWPTRSSSTGPRGSAPGGTRHQYVHAIDVMPTLLDLIGIEPPAVIGGIEQSPIEGVSFASTLADAGRAGDARHAVLRDARLAGAVPRRLEVGGVPPHAVHRLRRHRREQALRRRHLGAVPRGRRLLGGRRPGREGAGAARADEGAVVGGGGQVPGAAAQQRAGEVRRPPLAARALRATTRASARSPRRSPRTCATAASRWRPRSPCPRTGRSTA